MRWAGLATVGLAFVMPIGFASDSMEAIPNPGTFDPARLTGQIPEPMLSAYLDAADTWDVDWALLAAIGQLECDHGRSSDAGCWPPGTIDGFGARGPMKLRGSVWRATAADHDIEVAGPPAEDGAGYAVDGDGDGVADPWSSYDATHAAARYLLDLGVRQDPWKAADRYANDRHQGAGESYATQALDLAMQYRTITGTGGPGTPAAQPAPLGADCVLPDPSGTGGCVTPQAANLVIELERTFGPLPIACWGLRPNNPTSDHPHGRACDIIIGSIGRFPTSVERAEGWIIAEWLITNAERLALAYIIWDGWAWDQSGGWRPYTSSRYDVMSPSGGHYDHVHASVWA